MCGVVRHHAHHQALQIANKLSLMARQIHLLETSQKLLRTDTHRHTQTHTVSYTGQVVRWSVLPTEESAALDMANSCTRTPHH